MATYDTVRDFASSYAKMIHALIGRAGEVYSKQNTRSSSEYIWARDIYILASVIRSFIAQQTCRKVSRLLSDKADFRMGCMCNRRSHRIPGTRKSLLNLETRTGTRFCR